MGVFMAAYSQDLRDRVLRAVDRGDGVTSIASRFEVSVRWVDEVKRRYLRHGERSSRPVGGYRTSRIAGMERQIRAWIKKEADLTLAEICERLSQHGIMIKVPALWHQLNKWGLSFKKNPARQRARARRREESAAGVEGEPTNA